MSKYPRELRAWGICSFSACFTPQASCSHPLLINTEPISASLLGLLTSAPIHLIYRPLPILPSVAWGPTVSCPQFSEAPRAPQTSADMYKMSPGLLPDSNRSSPSRGPGRRSQLCHLLQWLQRRRSVSGSPPAHSWGRQSTDRDHFPGRATEHTVPTGDRTRAGGSGLVFLTMCLRPEPLRPVRPQASPPPPHREASHCVHLDGSNRSRELGLGQKSKEFQVWDKRKGSAHARTETRFWRGSF